MVARWRGVGSCKGGCWTRTHVCVASGDERLQVPFVWLIAADVRRR
jgi:hypothetical protein